MSVPAMMHASLQARATESGYTMALKWCLRCDVGWGGLGELKCWLCDADDEVYRWTYDSGGPKMRKVDA